MCLLILFFLSCNIAKTHIAICVFIIARPPLT